MDTVEIPEAVETKEKITPKDAFKEMITGLLDLVSRQKTPEEIQPNFLNWMPAIDRHVFERGEENEYNPKEIPDLDELEKFANKEPSVFYLKSSGGSIKLLLKQLPKPNSFFLQVFAGLETWQKDEQKKVFDKLSALASEAFEAGGEITAETRGDRIIFQHQPLTP